MRTPLQKYRQAMAEHGFEMTLAEAQKSRAEWFPLYRKIAMDCGVRCPTDDDAFQAWLLADDLVRVIERHCNFLQCCAQAKACLVAAHNAMKAGD